MDLWVFSKGSRMEQRVISIFSKCDYFFVQRNLRIYRIYIIRYLC